jgi:hypothetical protein
LVKKIENYLIGAGLFGIMAITGIAQAGGFDNELEK